MTTLGGGASGMQGSPHRKVKMKKKRKKEKKRKKIDRERERERERTSPAPKEMLRAVTGAVPAGNDDHRSAVGISRLNRIT